MKKINQVRRMEKKVAQLLEDTGVISYKASPERISAIHESVLYYLQVGEEVLNETIKDREKHKDDWHLEQSNEWRKVNCSKNCNHKLV